MSCIQEISKLASFTKLNVMLLILIDRVVRVCLYLKFMNVKHEYLTL